MDEVGLQLRQPDNCPLISFRQQNLHPHFTEPPVAVEPPPRWQREGGLRPAVPPLLTVMELWLLTLCRRYFLTPEAEVK